MLNPVLVDEVRNALDKKTVPRSADEVSISGVVLANYFTVLDVTASGRLHKCIIVPGANQRGPFKIITKWKITIDGTAYDFPGSGAWGTASSPKGMTPGLPYESGSGVSQSINSFPWEVPMPARFKTSCKVEAYYGISGTYDIEVVPFWEEIV
jgi:hypothetical protein